MIQKHRTNWLGEMTSKTYDGEMKSKAMLKVLAGLCLVAPLVGCAAVGAQEVRVYSGRHYNTCLLYTSPSPRDGLLSRMPSSA